MKYEKNLFNVENKIALVTGGATGIGRMMAEALAHGGAKVIIASRKGDECKKIAQEINKNIGEEKVMGFAGDLTTQASHKKFVEEIKKYTNELHILANNAGAAWGETFEEFPRDAWDKIMNLNVTAVFELTRDLMPLLVKTAMPDNPARVINTASVMGIVPVADGAYSYSVSKAAVVHLTKILANEFASQYVTVNALAPGPFPSKMTEFALNDPKMKEKVERQNPMGRIGRAEDIAGAMLFLCGKSGAYVTGATIPLDGGYCVSTHGKNIFPDKE